MTNDAGLGGRVRRGFFLSLLNNATLRLGTLATGIVLARILAPEDFGVYAVALTVQTILMNFSELGLAADLVRHGDIPRRGPVIATVSLASASVLTALMLVTAEPLARVLGAPEAAPAIRLMSATLLMAGVGVVPYAVLQRGLMQGRLFVVDGTSFVVTIVVTVALAMNDWGPMSLAVARVAAQVVSTILQFLVSGERPSFGWNRDIALSGLSFGFPLAGAGLLAWLLLGLDKVVIARASGPALLGLYVLAFNISSWPTSVVGTAVRAVAMPAFAQRGEERGGLDVVGLTRTTALTWAVAAPIGLCLAVLATPTIEVVYGDRWLPAAVALAGLGAFGALRVVFDVWVAFLTAAGRSGALLRIQGLWIIVLGPVMYSAVDRFGLRGAGWSHLVVAIGLVAPMYLWALARTGVPSGPVVKSLLPPLFALVPSGIAGWWVAGTVAEAWLQVILGGVSVLLVYAVAIWPWARRQPELAGLRRSRTAFAKLV